MANAKVPSTEPVQAPQEVPVQQVQQDSVQPPVQAQQPIGQTPPSTQQGANKQLLLVVGAVLLVVFGIAGYGYWNGSQVKSYAEKAEKTLLASKTWKSTLDVNFLSDLSSETSTKSGIKDAKDELENKKTDFEKVKTEIESKLAEINAASAPGKAGDLKKNVKEYLTVYKEVSAEALYTIEIGDSAMDVVESMLSIYGSDVDYTQEIDMDAALAKIQKAYEDWATALKNIKAPDSMKDQHDKFVKAIESAVASLEDGDVEALTNMDNPFDVNDIDSVVKKQTDRIDELNKIIEGQVNSLKNTTFSF